MNGTARKLSNPRDMHWRTDDEGYEYVMRTIFAKGQDMTEAHRKKWLTTGWRARLETMRRKHRQAGIPDSNFVWKLRKKT